MGAWEPNRCIYPSNALKAHLISTIAPAPGQDPEARIFLNYAGKVPIDDHTKKGGDFSCDTNCLNCSCRGPSLFLSTKRKDTRLLTTNVLKPIDKRTAP